MTSCVTDEDCPGTFTCYTSDQSWFEDVVDTTGNSTCACSTWYAWSGDDCMELTNYTYVLIALQLFVTVTAFVWACIGLHVLWRIRTVYKEDKFFNPSNITAIFSTCSLLVLATWRAILTVTFFSPDKLTASQASDTDKYSIYTPGDRVFGTLTALFATLSALNVSLMWLQVANSSKRFRRQHFKFGFYRKVIIAFEIIYSILIITLMIANLPSFATLVSFPFIIFVVITFSLGQIKMNSLLHSMTTGSKTGPASNSDDAAEGSDSGTGTDSKAESTRRYRNMMRLIRNTSRFVIFWGVIIIATGLAYALMAMNWREYAPIDGFPMVTLGNELFAIGILGISVSIQWYVWRIIRARARRGAKQNAAATSRGADPQSFTNTATMNAAAVTTYQPKSEASFNHDKFKEGAASFHADFDEEDEDVYDHTYDPNDDYV
ncbi:Hypothetical Protein FCC1311_002262 [Hondaea fermentalgiana]|uniref:Uncharacterized protein n=1 Tax=Hondaea fermentalgiana TaxID=2315210 RepID=A0A2R5G2Q2_9STRA|nr:Hypothetical Protein FCC1311_002262 [Hondaea fermentalgiana]|eukprot:GBG24008.1 Hypothetical Protein FCC1311_002262 [Hondaea fermentalgiana]